MTQRNTNKENPETGLASPKMLEGTFQMNESQGGGSAREFVDPGRDAKSMLMRTRLDSSQQAKDIAIAMDKMKEIEDNDGLELIQLTLAALCSVDGHGQDNLLQALTGYYNYTQVNSFKNKKAKPYQPTSDEDYYRSIQPGD